MPPSPRVDNLYAVPLLRFTSERNALVKRLREAGRTAEAAAVKRIRKPSAPLWAVNQLAHQNARAVSRFIEAVDRLRRAQLGHGSDMAEAAKAQREALNNLLAPAKTILSQARLKPTEAVLRRVSSTLMGAAAHREAREDLRAGQLTEEWAAPGFEVFSGDRFAPRPERALRKAPNRQSTERPIAQRREEDAATRREAKRRAREGQRRRRELEREAVQHERKAQAAAAEAQKLRERLNELEVRVSDERRAAEQARQAARRVV